jgi:hypothetical protein
MYQHIDNFRASRGLKGLAVHGVLVTKARNVAKFVAAGGCGLGPGGVPKICHSSLTEGVTVRWALLAENVGSASPKTNLAGVGQAFENSPGHAANILNRDIDYVGVGVAYWGNHVYVAEEFMAG